jgi:hypothetical protein
MFKIVLTGFIHAITSEGFLLKVVLLIFVFTIYYYYFN